MTVEAAHHTTAISSGEINPTISAPQDFELPQIQEQKRQSYEYPLQERISTEWANLLGDDFTLETNVAVFKDKVEQLEKLIEDPNATREDVLRKLSYIKIGAISIATSKGRDIDKYVDAKLNQMQDKYNPDAVTQLRLVGGHSTKEATGKLKKDYENGVIFQCEEVEIPPEEEEARLPRTPAFRDVYQDMSDTWMRRSYGRDLESHDSMEVVLNEAHELLAEFYDEEGNRLEDNMDEEKLDLVMGEIADVVISGDGKFSDEGECVEQWQNFALDRMIDTYGDVPKLRRERYNVPTSVSMEYLSECRKCDEAGRPRPIDKRIPDYYKGPFFRIHEKQPQRDSSSEMIH